MLLKFGDFLGGECVVAPHACRDDGGEPSGDVGQLPGPGQEPLPGQHIPGRLHDGQSPRIMTI
jgi:hypothetical protein